MEDLIDFIATDQSAAKISDRIKEILYTKTAERIDTIRPEVASSIFGSGIEQNSQEEE
jgi:hypothetical protein